MKALIQRVAEASVEVEGRRVAAIGCGLLVLLGVTHGDTLKEVAWLARKIAALRIFEDEQGLMNRSVSETGGAVIVV
ncbi:MAG TPA: D-aminoacyl-tRNA deacylase, partial [Kiritimatiellia bacterium]|nr:D-aminoacyl-tRNA deacylase [Kiritimatiellia bacterium]